MKLQENASFARFMAGDFGFLTLTQPGDRPLKENSPKERKEAKLNTRPARGKTFVKKCFKSLDYGWQSSEGWTEDERAASVATT